jgi:hypothetical protein
VTERKKVCLSTMSMHDVARVMEAMNVDPVGSDSPVATMSLVSKVEDSASHDNQFSKQSRARYIPRNTFPNDS